MGCCQGSKVTIVSPSTKVPPTKELLSKNAASYYYNNKNGGIQISGLSKAQRIFNNRSFAMSKNSLRSERDNYFLLSSRQVKTLLQLIMSDTMGNLYGQKFTKGELFVTQNIVSFLKFTELLRLSYSCKRIYIIMGDLRVLQRF